MTATEIRNKRRRAARLSERLRSHPVDALERAKLWAELTDDGVEVAQLALDSDVSPMAVRKALTNYRRAS